MMGSPASLENGCARERLLAKGSSYQNRKGDEMNRATELEDHGVGSVLAVAYVQVPQFVPRHARGARLRLKDRAGLGGMARIRPGSGLPRGDAAGSGPVRMVPASGPEKHGRRSVRDSLGIGLCGSSRPGPREAERQPA